MELRCPKCGLINPPTAEHCDCGWIFAAGRFSVEEEQDQARTAASRAKASWVCPVVAWGSQVIFVAAMQSTPQIRSLALWMMLLQGALIIAGLYFGLKVVMMGRAMVGASTWTTGLIGVILSGGTILLIAALSVATTFRLI